MDERTKMDEHTNQQSDSIATLVDQAASCAMVGIGLLARSGEALGATAKDVIDGVWPLLADAVEEVTAGGIRLSESPSLRPVTTADEGPSR